MSACCYCLYFRVVLVVFKRSAGFSVGKNTSSRHSGGCINCVGFWHVQYCRGTGKHRHQWVLLFVKDTGKTSSWISSYFYQVILFKFWLGFINPGYLHFSFPHFLLHFISHLLLFSDIHWCLSTCRIICTVRYQPSFASVLTLEIHPTDMILHD